MENYYREKIVVFIDVLGFKEKIKKTKESSVEAINVHAAINRIFETKVLNEGDSFSNGRDYGMEISTFSDSAVITIPASADNLFYIIMRLIHLQFNLVSYGFLIRGGITIGEIYHDGNIVYGPAMNKAYEMESTKAICPRIIIDEDTVNYYYENNNDEHDVQLFRKVIRLDSDNIYFVDILSQEEEFDDITDYYEWLSEYRKIIIIGLSEKEMKVQIKYIWLKEYFNDVITSIVTQRTKYAIEYSECFSELIIK